MTSLLHKRRVRTGKLGLALLLGLSLASTSFGQGSDVLRPFYFNQRTFEIPFDMSSYRSVVKVRLHHSTDGRHYDLAAVARPAAGHFVYTAQNDGWYFFVVQVEEVDGRLIPADVNRVPYGLRVCVDTRKPTIQIFRSIQPRDGTVAVEWKVRDETLALGTLRLSYRPVGSLRWTGLNIRTDLDHARFDWTPPTAGEYEVRLSVADMAGNVATETTRVKAGASPGEHGTRMPGTPRFIHVNKKTFRLKYRLDHVGPSSVKQVEVWMTRDTQQWTRYNVDAKPAGPEAHCGTVELKVPAPGRYGFTLRPISGVGRAHRPPDINEPPQLWVQVDEKAPLVRIVDVKLGEGKDTGTLTVFYTASDEFLKPRPINVYYAKAKEGPWEPLLPNQENTGSCVCKVDPAVHGHEFFLRVEAVDQAGNKGHDDTRDTVKADMSEPGVKEVTVESVEGEEKHGP
jgi:hypothetical protein